MNEDVECPYCGKWNEIQHDDGHGLSEDEAHEEMCGECEKYFVFYTCISFSYSAQKADCLNGSEHDWRPTFIFPKYWPNARHCLACSKRERGVILSPDERDRVDAEFKMESKK